VLLLKAEGPMPTTATAASPRCLAASFVVYPPVGSHDPFATERATPAHLNREATQIHHPALHLTGLPGVKTRNAPEPCASGRTRSLPHQVCKSNSLNLLPATRRTPSTCFFPIQDARAPEEPGFAKRTQFLAQTPRKETGYAPTRRTHFGFRPVREAPQFSLRAIPAKVRPATSRSLHLWDVL